jgi:hypothetical protein
VEEAIGGCGVERWSVKTGTDADVAMVQMQPVNSTIATLTGFTAPLSLPPNNRISPQERQTFVLRDINLVSYKLESDSDYHLVLSDGSRTMITEIPSPSCVGASSRFSSSIQSARATFDSRFHATTTKQFANVTATVTGVGFFDFLHGQDGVAPNGFELHPVLSICFGSGCSGGTTNDFSVATSPATRTVNRGSSTTYSVTTAVTSGSTQSLRLSISGLPSGVSGSLSPSVVNAGGSSTLRITVGTSARPSTTSFTLSAQGASGTHSATAALTVR